MVGKTIRHYQILDKLGEGGMGVVCKARDSHLNRFVAVYKGPHAGFGARQSVRYCSGSQL